MPPTLKSLLGRRSGGDVVGLDIQPGLVAAVRATVNGAVVVQRAVVKPLAADAVREGEVIDRVVLGETLRDLFEGSGLGKRVRVGVANQRTVMRTLELPPMDDRKELAAAVNFQAQDQVPMPLANAVLDFHPLGVINTPDGPRERVVLVAAQRDMIESLLDAVRTAGLQPVGVDLSAFALIRSLYRPGAADAGRVLYLNVDGLTNLAIADGPICSFTRVVGSGLEGMATQVAERRGIPLAAARQLIAEFDLDAPAQPSHEVQAPPLPAPARVQPEAEEDVAYAAEGDSGSREPAVLVDDASGPEHARDEQFAEGSELEGEAPVERESQSAAEHDAHEAEASYAELVDMDDLEDEPAIFTQASEEDIRAVVENGIREIAGEVRNSLDFHRSQEPAGEVVHVSLSGAALGINGFAEALAAALDMDVRAERIPLADKSVEGTLDANRLAVAAGLATLEAPR